MSRIHFSLAWMRYTSARRIGYLLSRDRRSPLDIRAAVCDSRDRAREKKPARSRSELLEPVLARRLDNWSVSGQLFRSTDRENSARDKARRRFVLPRRAPKAEWVAVPTRFAPAAS